MVGGLSAGLPAKVAGAEEYTPVGSLGGVLIPTGAHLQTLVQLPMHGRHHSKKSGAGSSSAMCRCFQRGF